jgi:hypothetical protein
MNAGGFCTGACGPTSFGHFLGKWAADNELYDSPVSSIFVHAAPIDLLMQQSVGN